MNVNLKPVWVYDVSWDNNKQKQKVYPTISRILSILNHFGETFF